MDILKVTEASKAYPKPEDAHYTYGTAGFRMNASLLDPVIFRVGVVATLRSLYLKGETVGVMITASHNPADDNGVKIVEPNGDMLPTQWEPIATRVCNAKDAHDLENILSNLILVLEITSDTNVIPSVVYGYDTRPSSGPLSIILDSALTASGAKVNNVGCVTTPELHYIVRCIYGIAHNDPYGEPSVQGYINKYAKAFVDALNGAEPLSQLTIDCANGVGALHAPKLIKHIDDIRKKNWDVTIANTEVTNGSALNHEAGADYVKTRQDAPPSLKPLQQGQRYASLDGDADRIVFYYANDKNEFRLLDGDKIATLIASYIMQLIDAIGGELKSNLNVGVVQTAYANGNSTKYLSETLQIPVQCAATGVKNLHHVAQSMDIGVYFEANGHGTILFSPKAQRLIRDHASQSTKGKELLATMDLINQTVGDALSDMLLVEMILAVTKTSVAEWDARYTDLPNQLAKVIVKDRTVFKTENQERTLSSPAGMQDKINAIVAKYPGGRSFVRPSGTEDCVRVYAEAQNADDVPKLISEVSDLVKNV